MKIKRHPRTCSSHPNHYDSAVINQLLECGEEEIPKVVSTHFLPMWKHPKGDLGKWIAVLDRFDQILYTISQQFALNRLQTHDFPPHIKELILSIVRLEKLLLENSCNRNLFASYDNLIVMLLCTDMEIAGAVLGLLRVPISNLQSFKGIKPYTDLMIPILEVFACKWNFRMLFRTGLADLCQRPNVPAISETAFKFGHYAVNDRAQGFVEQTVAEQSEQMDFRANVHKLAQQLGISGSGIFPLAFHLNQCWNMSTSWDSFYRFVVVRFLAIDLYCHLQPESTVNNELFMKEPELISDLGHVVFSDLKVPWEVKSAALYALGGICKNLVSKRNMVISEVGLGSPHGPIATTLGYLQQSVEMGKAVDWDGLFVDSMYHFLGIIASCLTRFNVLGSIGLVATLAKMIPVQKIDYLVIVSKSIILLDNLIESYPESYGDFVDNDGIEMLKREIEQLVPQFERRWEDEYVQTLHHNKLRGLLRLVIHLMQKHGTGNGLRNLVEGSLMGPVRYILENGDQFGSVLYTLGMLMLSTFIHNEPTSLAVIQETGLIEGFVRELAKGEIFASGEVAINIPHVLGAICLNSNGLETVLKHHILGKYFSIFATEKHMVILKEANVAGDVGCSFDELTRHHPGLGVAVTKSLIDVLDAIHKERDDESIDNKQITMGLIANMVKFLEQFFQTAQHVKEFVKSEGVSRLVNLGQLKDLPHDFATTNTSSGLSKLLRQISGVDSEAVVRVVFETLAKLVPRFGILGWHGSESFYIRFAGGDRVVGYSDEIQHLMHVHSQIRLLSDMYGSTTRSLLRTFGPTVLYLASKKGQQVLQDLNRLYRALVWEHCVFKKNISRADAMQPTTKNAKALKYLLSQIPSALISLFSVFPKVFSTRRDRPLDDQNKMIVYRTLAENIVSNLEWTKTTDDEEWFYYLSVIFGQITVSLLDKDYHRRRTWMQYPLIKTFINLQGVLKLFSILEKLVDYGTTESDTAESNTNFMNCLGDLLVLLDRLLDPGVVLNLDHGEQPKDQNGTVEMIKNGIRTSIWCWEHTLITKLPPRFTLMMMKLLSRFLVGYIEENDKDQIYRSEANSPFRDGLIRTLLHGVQQTIDRHELGLDFARQISNILGLVYRTDFPLNAIEYLFPVRFDSNLAIRLHISSLMCCSSVPTIKKRILRELKQVLDSRLLPILFQVELRQYWSDVVTPILLIIESLLSAEWIGEAIGDNEQGTLTMEQQDRLLEAVKRLMDNDGADESVCMSCLRILVILTRNPMFCQRIQDSFGIETLLKSLWALVPFNVNSAVLNSRASTSRWNLSNILSEKPPAIPALISMVVRHMIEGQGSVLSQQMKNDIVERLSSRSSRCLEFASYLSYNDYVSLRDPEQFVKVSETVCDLKEDERDRRLSLLCVVPDAEGGLGPGKDGKVGYRVIEGLLRQLGSETTDFETGCVKQCFVLSLLTELLISYPFLIEEYDQISQDGTVFSDALGFVFEKAIPNPNAETMSNLEFKLRDQRSYWGGFFVSSILLCNGEREVSKNESGINVDLRSRHQLERVKRVVVEHLLAAFKTSSDDVATKYQRYPAYGKVLYQALGCRVGMVFGSTTNASTGFRGLVEENHKKLIKLLIDKNVLSLLSAALLEIDLHHPQSSQVLKSLFRPMEILTRLANKLLKTDSQTDPREESDACMEEDSDNSETDPDEGETELSSHDIDEEEYGDDDYEAEESDSSMEDDSITGPVNYEDNDMDIVIRPFDTETGDASEDSDHEHHIRLLDGNSNVSYTMPTRMLGGWNEGSDQSDEDYGTDVVDVTELALPNDIRSPRFGRLDQVSASDEEPATTFDYDEDVIHIRMNDEYDEEAGGSDVGRFLNSFLVSRNQESRMDREVLYGARSRTQSMSLDTSDSIIVDEVFGGDEHVMSNLPPGLIALDELIRSVREGMLPDDLDLVEMGSFENGQENIVIQPLLSLFSSGSVNRTQVDELYTVSSSTLATSGLGSHLYHQTLRGSVDSELSSVAGSKHAKPALPETETELKQRLTDFFGTFSQKYGIGLLRPFLRMHKIECTDEQVVEKVVDTGVDLLAKWAAICLIREFSIQSTNRRWYQEAGVLYGMDNMSIIAMGRMKDLLLSRLEQKHKRSQIVSVDEDDGETTERDNASATSVEGAEPMDDIVANQSLEDAQEMEEELPILYITPELDASVLEELPEDMRGEILRQYFEERRRNNPGRVMLAITPEYLEAISDAEIRELILREEMEEREQDAVRRRQESRPEDRSRVSGTDYGMEIFIETDQRASGDQGSGISRILSRQLAGALDDFVNSTIRNTGLRRPISMFERNSRENVGTGIVNENIVLVGLGNTLLYDLTSIITIVRTILHLDLVEKRLHLRLVVDMCEDETACREVVLVLLRVLCEEVGDYKGLDGLLNNYLCQRIRGQTPKKHKNHNGVEFTHHLTPVSYREICRRALQILAYLLHQEPKNIQTIVSPIPGDFHLFSKRLESREYRTLREDRFKTPIQVLIGLLEPYSHWLDAFQILLHLVSFVLEGCETKETRIPIPRFAIQNLVKIAQSPNLNHKSASSYAQIVKCLAQFEGEVVVETLVQCIKECVERSLGTLEQYRDLLREHIDGDRLWKFVRGHLTGRKSWQIPVLRLLEASTGLAQIQSGNRILCPLEFEDIWRICEEILGTVESEHGLGHVNNILPTLETLFMFFDQAKDGELRNRIGAFVERHRQILNTLIRSNPGLLQRSFRVLINQFSRVVDFENKLEYFRLQLHKKTPEKDENHGTIHLSVRRSHIFEDSFHQLMGRSGAQVKHGKLHVRFYGEEGVDAGGLTREWFSVLSRQMFNPDYALFKTSAMDNITYQPNHMSYANPEHLQYFKFVGRVIGKAIYDSKLLDCYFTRSFYKRILGIAVDYKDMEATDPSFYNSLVWILEHNITGLLDLCFSIEVDTFGVTRHVELVPDGRRMAVTEENKHEYVRLVTEMKLTKAVQHQLDAFLRGFHEIIPHELVSCFNEQELELLISGMPEIDVDDWRNNSEYYGGYDSSSPQIQWFWRAVRSFDLEQRAKLLQFTTGTSKVPLEGFSALQGSSGVQKFQIHKDFGPTNRLPTAHTCFNQLDLPVYDSFEILRKNLLVAMNEGSVGFGLA